VPRLRHAGRLLALTLLASALGGGVALVHGPWLRVQQLAHAGTQFTPAAAVEEVIADYRGSPVLALDSEALADRLQALPAVASVRVEPLLPDRLSVTIEEKEPAFVWVTGTARLVGAADGTLIVAFERDADPPPAVASLPTVDDQRASSRELAVGDLIGPAELDLALGILALDPARLGSRSSGLGLRIDRTYGFVLVSTDPAWRAALGFPQRETDADASIGPTAAASRLEAQVAAIRTLFRGTGETGVTWLDVRNPGKVYWAR
jgi:cell division protein FtsQ